MENSHGTQLQESALQDGVDRVARPSAKIQGTVSAPFLHLSCSRLGLKSFLQKTTWVNGRYSGLVPNEQGQPYTSPAVKFDSSTYIQDSAKIALELEERYPEPSLRLDSLLLPKAYAAVSAISEIIRPILMHKVVSNLLTERSADYISRTRDEALRESREEYVKESVIGEVWTKLEEPVKNLAALIRGQGGPFVMGKTRKLFLLLLAMLKWDTVEREQDKKS